MLNCTINGKSLEVPEGTSIIEAFKMLDEDIAHYCWHPGLSVAGVCRLCMVEIEGNPRLQIACNTPVQDGMVVTNQSEMVKDAVKWGLDFHLINHPLDCPICDQAGECGLQDQYMKFGRYDSEMGQAKVKKKKVVDLGPKIVLDSERCILCSRCVRFTDEVSKTHELGIFHRGDHSEIGTYAGKPLDNDYAINTVDICPVGALTSKDFRFRQRVWFLKDKPSICTGCSTGCHVDVYYNKEGMWRVKPRYSEDVNGYWMCDKGRDIYKGTNPFLTEFVGERGHKKALKKANRLQEVMEKGSKKDSWSFEETTIWLDSFKRKLSRAKTAALVVTGQYSLEEYNDLFTYWTSKFPDQPVYHWLNHPEQVDEFDGLLLRGDKNPNTKGLEKAAADHKIKLVKKMKDFSDCDLVMVAGPENLWTFDDIESKAELFSQAKRVVWMSACRLPSIESMPGNWNFVPAKTFAEKSGTFINHAGVEQSFDRIDIFVESALSLSEMAHILQGEDVELEKADSVVRVQNQFIHERGHV